MDIEAARLLTYRAAWLADQGKFTKEYVPFLSMAKYYATELAVRASGLAVQLLGAAGYMEDHPTELWYRDARQLTIVEGTSQVQLGLIARGRARPRSVVGLMAGDPTAAETEGPSADHPAFDVTGGWPGVLTDLLAGTSLTATRPRRSSARCWPGRRPRPRSPRWPSPCGPRASRSRR